jgi:deazaflavin-dependent oxidoreductase (nitroreductase family)
MRRLLLLAFVLGTFAAVVRSRLLVSRPGAGLTNDLVNPFLMSRRLVGSGGSHLATLEHVGRRSGTRRLTPLHPILQPGGVRFAVPLGDRSEWARNVVAAGHCRIQLGDRIQELDEPRLLEPADVDGIDPVTSAITGWLGWRYLVLRRFDEHPGSLAITTPVPGMTEPVVQAAETV